MSKFDLMYTRRRYGGASGTTYTWIAVRSGDNWHDLGDPWPCINPAKKEVLESLAQTLLHRSLPLTGSGETTGNWAKIKGFKTIEIDLPVD